MSDNDPSERWREISGEQHPSGSEEPPTRYGGASTNPSGGSGPVPSPYGSDPYAKDPYGQQGQSPYGQDPYGQNPYGQQGYGGVPGPYGYGGPPGYGYAPPMNHPQAVTALVVGLISTVGAFVCGVTILLSPWAWIVGSRAMKEIDASGGKLGGRGQAQAGMIMGIVGTVLMVLGVAGLVLLIVGIAASGA